MESKDQVDRAVLLIQLFPSSYHSGNYIRHNQFEGVAEVEADKKPRVVQPVVESSKLRMPALDRRLPQEQAG